MAKKQPAISNPDDDFQVVDETGQQENDELSAVANAFDCLTHDAASILLSRRMTGSNKLAFLEEYTPQLFFVASRS